MLHMNRVTLLGHAGRDPEGRKLPDDERTASFTLATTRRWKSDGGAAVEKTDWHRVVVYGGAVEPTEEFVRKGSLVLVEGRLATREYDDSKGIRRQVAAKSAEAGVEADLAIIRHPDQGIRNPDSIFDFSCIRDLFDYRAFDVLFDPAGALDDILDLARRRICAAARDAYRRYLGRALDASVYTVPARRLPGLDLDWQRRHVLEDIGAGDADAELFRSVVEDGR